MDILGLSRADVSRQDVHLRCRRVALRENALLLTLIRALARRVAQDAGNAPQDASKRTHSSISPGETEMVRETSATADYDAIVEQLAALREDMKKLAGSVSSAAGHRQRALTRDVTDGMTEAAEYVGRRTHDVEARLEHALTANPFRAIGLSVAIGLILGALWRR
jgi:ElaB/YqjD/DUF883 family membrane-anchored ribosome-binding protein